MKKKNLLKNDAVQSLLASLGCIVFGLLVGYVVLLFIQPKGAGKAILTIIENFFTYNRAETQMKYLGSTLVKTAPLLMCSLSILFAYKVGLFNIGAAGQYVVGSCASLYAALAWGWSWLPCMLLAIAAGMAAGAIVGLLKTFCNVNEVISGIMLNWIFLYATNMILTNVKEVASPYTYQMHSAAQQALLPSLGLDKLFSGNQYVTIAIPLAILMAILVWVVLEKTRFGYELKATGFNKHAAKYCGMAEKRNVILSLVISGALAGMGAALLYLTGYEQWQCTHSSVPNMGFNGICAGERLDVMAARRIQSCPQRSQLCWIRDSSLLRMGSPNRFNEFGNAAAAGNAFHTPAFSVTADDVDSRTADRTGSAKKRNGLHRFLFVVSLCGRRIFRLLRKAG